MAGRPDKQSSGKPPAPHAVEDASRLLFEIDRAIATPASAASSGGPKPHSHHHRARLRKRFEEAGKSAFADYELLELLLFRSIPRRDAKPLAKALIARFGDLAAVLGAPAHLIAEIDGAGPSVAQDLKVIHAVLERAAKVEIAQRTVIGSWSQLVNHCRVSMAHARREQFRVLFLDVKNQLIADEVLNEGAIDHARVYPREVARRALELSAGAVILVHNHPSGDPKPSAADITITREIVAAASAVGVKVHDHIVIGRNGAESFKSLVIL